MSKKPLFSIITVTFNAQDYIERTVRSVQAQTYPYVEHLIIDGASRDRTLEILSAYPHCKVLSEPDKGLYDAMNKGLGLAKGDYICFLNAGDTLHLDTTLEDIVTSLKGATADVLYGETDIVDAEGRFLRTRRHKAPETLSWRSFENGMLVCHQSFYISARFKDVPYDLSYRFSADFDWCVRILKLSERVHNTHLVLTDYLQEGLSTKNRTASLRERFHIMSHHYGLIRTIAMHLWFIPRAILRP